jgi:hypothetical protein
MRIHRTEATRTHAARHVAAVARFGAVAAQAAGRLGRSFHGMPSQKVGRVYEVAAYLGSVATLDRHVLTDVVAIVATLRGVAGRTLHRGRHGQCAMPAIPARAVRKERLGH